MASGQEDEDERQIDETVYSFGTQCPLSCQKKPHHTYFASDRGVSEHVTVDSGCRASQVRAKTFSTLPEGRGRTHHGSNHTAVEQSLDASTCRGHGGRLEVRKMTGMTVPQSRISGSAFSSTDTTSGNFIETGRMTFSAQDVLSRFRHTAPFAEQVQDIEWARSAFYDAPLPASSNFDDDISARRRFEWCVGFRAGRFQLRVLLPTARIGAQSFRPAQPLPRDRSQFTRRHGLAPRPDWFQESDSYWSTRATYFRPRSCTPELERYYTAIVTDLGLPNELARVTRVGPPGPENDWLGDEGGHFREGASPVSSQHCSRRFDSATAVLCQCDSYRSLQAPDFSRCGSRIELDSAAHFRQAPRLSAGLHP
ncbi:hypothetical protein MRB53_038714 [Persea americana]|nr:hypothetical protein MRB53_038714 [Persea americana]